MLVDHAMAMLLTGGAMMAPPATGGRAAAAADMAMPQPTFNHRTAHAQAMLMSPMPVLANMMKEQVGLQVSN